MKYFRWLDALFPEEWKGESRRRALMIGAVILLPPTLLLAAATGLGWLRYEFSLAGVILLYGAYMGWATLWEKIAKIWSVWGPAEPSATRVGVTGAGRETPAVPPAGRSGPPSMAPPPMASFIGREEEIERLLRGLERGKRVAITGVVGMEGIGKTELARIVADRVAGRYRDGVLWADCGRQEMATITDLWAAEYGAQLTGDDLVSKAAGWRSLVSSKEALLVFDNVQPDQEIEALFPPPGWNTALITTRHAQHPALREIEPLRLDRFREVEAMALAKRVLGEETVVAQRVDAMHFFELVGYLPLAVSIGLDTARDRGWRLAELSRELERTGALWALDEAAVRKSLGATFETAWNNLPEELQRAFAVLAVFSRGPSFHTAAMADVLRVEEVGARGLLNRLVGRSLLSDLGDGRWSLHAMLREFVAWKLAAEDPAWGRMAAHYVQVAIACDELYRRGGDDVLGGLRLFDLEWPHIRAGQAWAAGHAEADDEAGRLCSLYAVGAANCLDVRVSAGDRIPWIEAAVLAARQVSDRWTEGGHLGNLGLAYAALGKVREAICYYEQALEIAREIGDRRGESTSLGNLGTAYRRLGEVREGISYHKWALEIAREIGDRRGESNALGSLGLAYAALGELREAICHYEQALEIAREIGDRRMEGNALANLGLVYVGLGDRGKGRKLWEDALAIFEAIEDPNAEQVRGWLEGLGL